MKTRFLKLALLAVFCVGATATNAQTNLSEEAVKVIKELKQVDTKGLSADEAQTVMEVLNQIKRENSPRVEMPEIICRGSQTQYPRVELAGMKVDAISIAEKPLFILNGKEISYDEFKRLNPNCVEGLKLIKGEEAVNKYGEKAANGVLLITAKNDCKQQKIDNEDVEIIYNGKVISEEEAEKMGIFVNVIVKEIKDNQQQIVGAKCQRIAEMQQCRAAQQQAQGPIRGFMSVRAGKIDTQNIDSKEEAVQLIDNGKVLILLDGIEISEEKFKSLDPNSIEKLELRKGETMKVLYGEKAADGVIVITSKKANQEKVQVTGFTTVRKGKGDVTTEPIVNVDLAVKAVNQGNVLVILDGIEISEEKLKSLDPNSIEKVELRKGETMKVLYGEKAAGGVIMITSKKVGSENTQSDSRQAAQQQSQGLVQGFMSVRAGKMDIKYIDSKEEAVQLIDNGKVLIILDGIEISEEKFKSLDPNSIERLELIKGETMKVLYGKKTDDGMLMITSKKSGSENAQRVSRRANTENVHVVGKSDLRPMSQANAMSALKNIRITPELHFRGSMAKIENVNSKELPRITKFKQNGNQVSFRIEVPKSADSKKQKVDINYTLPN